MNTFIQDLKILYPLMIKEIIKKYFIVCGVMSILLWLEDRVISYDKSILNMYDLLIIIWVTIGIAFIVGFLLLYFDKYKKQLEEIRREVEMEMKYQKLYKQFMDTF